MAQSVVPAILKLNDAQKRQKVYYGNPHNPTVTDRLTQEQGEWWFWLIARATVVGVFGALLYMGMTHQK